MSLTSFLQSSPDVREYLRYAFPKPATPRPRELLAPPMTKNYALVGTAFDYALRWCIQASNSAVGIRRPWIAEEAVSFLTDSAIRSSAIAIVRRARLRVETFLQSRKLTPRLLESALELSRLDPVLRVGLGQEAIGRPVDRDDVNDLRRLVGLVPKQLLRRHPVCILNPTFNSSDLVAGADADLLVGDLLVDVKVTKDPKIWREHFNQLIGYYLLFRIGGFAAIRKQPRVARLGIYLARYGTLVTWWLKDIASPGQFARAQRWFLRRAKKEHRHPSTGE